MKNSLNVSILLGIERLRRRCRSLCVFPQITCWSAISRIKTFFGDHYHVVVCNTSMRTYPLLGNYRRPVLDGSESQFYRQLGARGLKSFNLRGDIIDMIWHLMQPPREKIHTFGILSTSWRWTQDQVRVRFAGVTRRTVTSKRQDQWPVIFFR